MRRTIAIGFMALALAGPANAQTADERARILREFDRQVADYTHQHECLDVLPEALNAAAPAPRIFTPPVAMVFRQLIARALANRGAPAINGVGAFPHPTVLEPFPSTALHDFPPVMRDALPPLPPPLEYRLIGHDLVIRDAAADIIVAVLRDAVGGRLTLIR
jgi:hypothetical protein